MEIIVVGVDGSESAANALRWAVREGEVRDQTVVAVLSWGFLDQHHADPGATFDPDYDLDHALAALDAYVVAAVGDEVAERVERQAPCDLAAPALVAASADASLLVVGARGLGGFKGLLLGSVSQHCLHHARCPVAVIREVPQPPADGSPERVVVGVDGSESAATALRWAVAEATARGAELEVVHAWHLPYAGGYPYTTAVFDPTMFEEAAKETVREALGGVDLSGLAHPVRTVLVNEGASPALLETAKGADLVVTGSRGLGGFRGLLLGSVSHQVAHHATCPVVIVPWEG
jgi:nucleotide-binding universal stress UspA family protein